MNMRNFSKYVELSKSGRAMENQEGSDATCGHSSVTSRMLPDQSLNLLKDEILAAAADGSAENLKKLWEEHGNLKVWKVLELAKDEDGLTPLHRAVIEEHKDAVEAFFQSGAPEDDAAYFKFLHARTRNGLSSLHLAALSGDGAILEVLIAMYNSFSKFSPGPWDFTDDLWMTPLHYAVLGNKQKQISLLLNWPDYQDHVNARDYFQRSPLHLAACHRPVSVKPFLQHPTVDINAKDCFLQTPFHWAVSFGRVDVVECLVISVNAHVENRAVRASHRDIAGRSPLEIAMEGELLDVLPVVLKGKPSVPSDHDRIFLMDRRKLIHRAVGKDIEKLLLDCSDVKVEAERMQKNLETYMNAVNAFLVVGAVISGASYQVSIGGVSEMIFGLFLLSKALAFYGSLITLLAGAATLRPLRKFESIHQRVRSVRSALIAVSGMIAITVVFYVLAFTAQNSAHVTEGTYKWDLRLPYLSLSIVGLFLCLLVIRSFLKQQDHLSPILSMIWRGLDTFTQVIEVVRVITHVLQHIFGAFMRVGRQRLLLLRTRLKRLLPSSWVYGKLELKMKQAYPGYHVCNENDLWDTEEEMRSSYDKITEVIKDRKDQTIDRPSLRLPIAFCIFEFIWCSMFLTGLGFLSRFVMSVYFDYFVLILMFSVGNIMFKLLKSKIVEKVFHLKASGLGLHYRYVGAKAPNKSAGQPGDCDLAEGYWARQQFSPEVTDQFKAHVKEVQHLENAYKELTKDMGDQDPKSLQRARHNMFFLDRLPNGLFFWMHNSDRLSAGSMSCFYRGYTFGWDLKIFEELSSNLFRKRRN